MKEDFNNDMVEESVILISLVKWMALALLAGVGVGIIASVFIKIVGITTSYVGKFKYFYLFMPFAFFMSSYIVLKLAPDAAGHGTEKAIEAVTINSGKMDIKAIPIKMITTIITVTFGGSVGLEGPCTQVGAGAASFCSKLLGLKDDMDRKRFVVCGIAAGFVAVFGAPVGAAIFASEILYIGRLSYMSLFPALIASFASYSVGRFMGTKALISYYIDISKIKPSSMFFHMALFGLFIGIIAVLFIRLVNYVEKLFNNIKIYKPLKGLIGGSLIVVFILLVGSKDYLGIGEPIINSAVSGEHISGLAFLGKMLTTSITLGSGGSGGILTPMLFIGSTAGSAWAGLLNLKPSLFAAVGMVAFLSACANTPIAAIVISMELFGAEVGTYAAIACVISYLLVGHRSIYPTQVIALGKTPSIEVDEELQVKDIQSHLKVKFKNKIVRRIIKKK